MAAPADVVRSFCSAWEDGDLDRIIDFFADDAVYHNIPLDPVTGKDAIRTTIEGFSARADKIEFRVLNLAADGDVVLTERVDVFHVPGNTIELPVMGTFEVDGERITAWRDYFDLQQLMSQLSG